MSTRAAPPQPLAPVLASALHELEQSLSTMGSMVVAFSGGVDSTLLLHVAASLPSVRCVAVTTQSPTTTDDEIDEARKLARSFKARHVVMPVDELSTPGYADNPPDRCYLCKQTLYPLCFRIASAEGLAWVVDGVNADDLSDHRPGLRAAAELGVRHPLVETALRKDDVRALSRWFRLPTADKPASPCLSSRFPYGTRITHERLGRVARAEAAVRGLGVRELRVRYYDDTARVEIGAAEHGRLSDPGLRHAIETGVRAAGFVHVEIAPEPLRSGRLNDVLKADKAVIGAPFNPEAGDEPARGRRDE